MPKPKKQKQPLTLEQQVEKEVNSKQELLNAGNSVLHFHQKNTRKFVKKALQYMIKNIDNVKCNSNNYAGNINAELHDYDFNIGVSIGIHMVNDECYGDKSVSLGEITGEECENPGKAF